MGGKAKAQGPPQVGQHEPPGRVPQQFWCQRSCPGPVPVVAGAGIRAWLQTAAGVSDLSRTGTWPMPQQKCGCAWIRPPEG